MESTGTTPAVSTVPRGARASGNPLKNISNHALCLSEVGGSDHRRISPSKGTEGAQDRAAGLGWTARPPRPAGRPQALPCRARAGIHVGSYNMTRLGYSGYY